MYRKMCAAKTLAWRANAGINPCRGDRSEIQLTCGGVGEEVGENDSKMHSNACAVERR